MKAKSVRRSVIALVICAVLLLGGCVWMALRYRGEQTNMVNLYSSWPAIRTQAQLEEALAGPPVSCRILSVPVSGTPVADASGLLPGAYLYVSVLREEVVDVDDGEQTRLEWAQTAETSSAAEQLLLCGQYPVEGDLHFALQARRPDSYASSAWDGQNRCYPGGRTAMTAGAERYTFCYLLEGEFVSLLAEVGNGRVVASAIHGEPTITDRTSAEALAQGHLGLPSTSKTAAIALGAAAGLTLILAVVLGLRGRRRGAQEAA